MNPLWKHKCIYTLSWYRFETMIRSLADEIKDAKIQPDVIVGIGKGGLIPSIRLFHLLDAHHYGIISIARNTSREYFSKRADPRADWSQLPDSKSSCALLVDDIVGTGDTLTLAQNILRQSHTGLIKTLSVVVNENSDYAPDYFGCKSDDWVIFPWESTGDEQSSNYDLELVPL